ncbi:MAG: hypothetical protein RIT01_348 [Pseudomonadota bacterium]|jgi:hypothetical protein
MKTTIGLITENVPQFPLASMKGSFLDHYDQYVASALTMLTRVPNAEPGRLGYVYNSLISNQLYNNIPWYINIPAFQSSSTSEIKNKVKQVLESEFSIFNVDVVESYNALSSSNSERKIAVIFIDQSTLFNASITNESDPFLMLARHAAIKKRFDVEGFENVYSFFNDDLQSSTSYIIYPLKNAFIGGVYIGITPDPKNLTADFLEVVFVFTDLVEFEEEPSLLSGGVPHLASGHPKYCNYLKQGQNSVISLPLSMIANTALHEIGHAFGLKHHGTATEEYYDSPLNVWVPIMGDAFAGQINQWNNGNYPNASNPNQDDTFNISYNASFRKIPQGHPVLSGPDKWNDFYQNSEKLNAQNKKLITRNARLISKDDIITVEGVTTIEGLIGFPEDSDILKIILKAGSYEISDYPNMRIAGDSHYITMACFNIQILKSQNTEISKQTTDLNQPKRIPNHENNSNPTEFTCSADDLPNPFPDNSKNACSAILVPEEVHESRPPLTEANAIVTPSPDTFNGARSILNLSIGATCLVYLKISGDKIEGSQDFTSYGSLGKYNIIIKNNDTGSFDLNSILSEKAPPNCYATEKFTSFYPDQSLLYEDIFFTQDRSDFGSNEVYNGSSDHPHVKKFNIVINGTIKEIPILLQGKEYTDFSEIEDWTDKRLFHITNEDGDSKIQEFVIAPPHDF